MQEIRLPNNWEPRWYQKKAWDYLGVERNDTSGKHAELIWHRRAGKDEICLHAAATDMYVNPASYWHMLPKKEQVRKAIWEAVNPHTGKRRIYEAFPPELFSHRESDMMVFAKGNASTWQCIGSDNYDTAVGSSTRGITYSEWALANPSARGYLRPIITENRGWQMFITTPRGRNHAHSTFQAARDNPSQFAQLLTVHDTQALKPQQLIEELIEYKATYGEDYGLALFEQEYECSFDAAIIGSFWGDEIREMESDGRLCGVEHDDRYPVHVGTDLGRTDDLSIWWFQVIDGYIRVLEHHAISGKDPDYFASQLTGREMHINIVRGGLEVETGSVIEGIEHRQEYNYGRIGLPHDGAAKTFSAKGKSVQEQLSKVFGWSKITVVPRLSKQDQIQAGRKAIRRAFFNYEPPHHKDCETDNGLDGLREYHREWDDEKKMFSDNAVHDWSSHRADAWMQVAVMWDFELLPKEHESTRWSLDRTFEEYVKLNRKRRIKNR